MTCPYLTYKSGDGEREFNHERPYCNAAETFVQPLRSDICNDVGEFSHPEHCEIYREATSSD